MKDFRSLGLPELLLQSLEAMKFDVPTPIQAQTIPLGLEGKDVLGSAQTGTGKTAAFGIPLVNNLLVNPKASALVLAPTRELAVQVLETLKLLIGKKSGIKSALLIGGEPIFRQLRQLDMDPRIIIGTPGRINDHLDRGSLDLSTTQFLVLDEADRMLDMGFAPQLEQIADYLPKVRQTLMFSATMNSTIERLAGAYLNSPVRVSVGSTSKPTENVEQEIVQTTEAEKFDVLLDKIKTFQGSIIIFVKTKFGTEKLAKKLYDAGYKADAIHGDLRQSARDRVIKAFRDGKYQILVATDVAARGLDIPHIGCVINFDLPQCPEDYIHRIGRTGRAGAKGKAINIITRQDGMKWRAICRLISPETCKDEPRGERSGVGGRSGSRSRSGGSSSGYGGRRSSGGSSSGFGGRRSSSTGDRSDRYGDQGSEDRPRRSSSSFGGGFKRRSDGEGSGVSRGRFGTKKRGPKSE